MEPLSTAAIAIVSKLVMTEVAKAVLTGVKNQLQPDKMDRLLKNAIESAQATQPETGGLFFRCQSKVAKEFLEQFFKSSTVVKELQKPLQDNGKPDVAVLVEAFDRSAKQYSGMQDYIPDSLRSWIETFVDNYFEQIQGICFQVAKDRYLKQLAQRVDDVKFVGIAVSGEEEQKFLAKIFVMPDVREEKRNFSETKTFVSYFQSVRLMRIMDGNTGEEISITQIPEQTSNYKNQTSATRNNILEEQKSWAMRDRSAPQIPAQKVINLAHKKAVVLGAPGSGKTTLASYFALMLCGTEQSDPTQIGLEKDDDYLPVVVRIRDWILQPNTGLMEYLRSNAEASLACKELPTGFFEHWLDRGKALILLDGLDEVVDEAQRRKIAEQIETFLHQYQNNPAIITSRPAGYRWDFFNLDEFPHYTLESFDDKQVATFIDHWYDSRAENKAQADRLKADLQKAFARNERIKLLAKNPLLLTIIALIHRYQADLPKQRYKLYEKAVETLLTSWDSGKEIKLYSQVLLFLKSDDLLYILKKLAYWIHTQGSTGETEGGKLIDKDELIQQLRAEIQKTTACKTHEAKAEAERFVDFIQKRTGLLNEQGTDRYAFVHKTFQEYLTAEEIYEIDESGEDTEIIEKHFREHLHDQHWREVLLLLVSKLKGKKAQKAIQTVLEAESEYEQWLHRDLLFAGWCLTEDPSRLTTVAKDFVGEILDRLVGLEVEEVEQVGSKTRGELEKILHCLGETTVEKFVWEKLTAQGDLIDHFRLLEFQAALGQEADALSKLLSLLCNQSSNIRYCAVEALGKLGNGSSEVVNSLFSMLNDEEWDVAINAAIALGQRGSSSPEVVCRLLSLLGNKEWDVCSGIAEALGRLGNGSPEVVSSLLSLLGSEHLFVCGSAAEALGKLGNGSSEVVNSLLSMVSYDEWLDYDEWHVAVDAALALNRLGNDSSEVVSFLLSSLGNQESNVRSSAATALIQLGNGSPEVVNGLLSLLGDEESDVRDNAAAALGQLGNSTSEVVNSLLSLLGDESTFVRSSAAAALIRLGNGTSEVVNSLLSLLGYDSPHVRLRASLALSQLAKTSDTIRPKVVQWLEQNPRDEIGRAIDCLWSIVVE